MRFWTPRDDGNHYALDVDEKDQWIFFDAINSRPVFTLAGNMTQGSDSIYDIAGTIEIDYIKQR